MKTLTVGLIVPAKKVGALGARAPSGRQAPPSGPAVSRKELSSSAPAPAGEVHGVSRPSLTCLPQSSGVFSGARAREEFDAEVFDWQLGVVPEAERDLPVLGSGSWSGALVIDEQAWKELSLAHTEFANRIFEIQAESKERLERSEEDAIHARAILAFFEMPNGF